MKYFISWYFFPSIGEWLSAPLEDEGQIKPRKKKFIQISYLHWGNVQLCVCNLCTSRHQTLSTGTSLILSSDKAQEMVANTFSGPWLRRAYPELIRVHGSLLSWRSWQHSLLMESPSHHSHTLHPQPDMGCLAMTLDILHKYVGLLELYEEVVLAHTVLTDSGGQGQK